MKRLRVNPILCDAHGFCADLIAERIRLDRWGYPIVDQTELSDELMAAANEAVRTCPRNALVIEEVK